MKDYSNVRAVCFDCARNAGFTPKKKAVGVWIGKCEICLMQKPCTDLWHDWIPYAKKDEPLERNVLSSRQSSSVKNL